MDKKNNGPGISIGLLTAENRDTWTKVRQELIKTSVKNEISLDLIERSVFGVCLDKDTPITKEETSRYKI